MTNKQIIIDGVDVSECEHFCRGTCCQEGFGASASCKLFSDCHYKQLQRKEQECEYLKKKLLRKEAVIEFASCPSYGYSDNTIEATCTKTFCYDIETCEHKTMVKYKQALKEIKEIAEEQCCICEELTPVDEYKDCKKCWQKQILEKCEVIDETKTNNTL